MYVTIDSVGMVPLWMFTLGQYILDKNEASITIPFQNMLISMAIQTLSIGVGYVIKMKLPRAAKIIGRLLKPLLIIVIIFVFSVGIYANLYIFRMFSPTMILAGCLLPYR